MIQMRLKGGLGNQLFQYALGRHLSLIHKSPLLLDITSFDGDMLRNYSLDAFNICAQIAPPRFKNTLPRRLINKIQLTKLFNYFCPSESFILENKFAFEPEILNCPEDSYLDGYWQSHRYFDAIAPIIRSDLTLKYPLSEYLAILESEIRSTNSVSIHVRRGDYANNPATTTYHGLCSLDWYQQAFDKMQALVADAKYFVFSDDPDWVKANLKLNVPTIYIFPSADGQEAQDLYLMSQCQHHIIANSSFSWWAAWLNPNIKKNIIAPKIWFSGADHDTRDLIPNDWIRI